MRIRDFIHFSTLLCLFAATQDHITPSNSLVISVYDVLLNAVEIDWHYKDHLSPLISCEMFYGPVSNPAQVHVYTGIIIVPQEHLFKLNGLENNVTYRLHMICHNEKSENFHSNMLQFTTGSKAFPMNFIMPANTYGRSSVIRDSFHLRDEDHIRVVRSSNVILGAVCGIVGFLIINVTIVMVVRKYSHRQMHRRRIVGIEERDYEEFPYPRGYD